MSASTTAAAERIAAIVQRRRDAGEYSLEDVAAERAVLGGILGDPRKLLEVAPLLRPNDFGNAARAAIFAAMLELDHAARAIDPLTVADALRSAGKLDSVGGMSAIADLDTAAPSAANAAEYARIVAACASRRRVQTIASDIAARAASGGDATSLVADGQAKLADAIPPSAKGGLEPASAVLDRALDTLERAAKSGGGITGLPSGFADFDRMTTGMHGGELLVLAARPGVGKTSLAVNIACHAAVKQREPVAVFSLEMPNEQLMQRVLSAEGGVPLEKIRSGKASEYEHSKISEAAARIYQAPLHLDETPAITLYEIRNRLRMFVAKVGALGLVIVDYLQLMGSASRYGNREQEVAANSRGLKQLAKEFSVPVLALAQLSRRAEQREGPPKLSDLRESGAIEQDADVVMFLHPGDAEGTELGAAPVDLVLAKQRNGPVGTVGLTLRSAITRFEGRSWHEP